MNINNLFPTPVGFARLDRELTEQEIIGRFYSLLN